MTSSAGREPWVGVRQEARTDDGLARSARSGGPRAPVKVLLVEDDPVDAELVLLELRRGGLEVDWRVVDERESLESALGSFVPDVVLSDYTMPLLDGWTAMQVARSRLPSIPFLFVSGSIGEERATEALRAGATDCIPKHALGRLSPAVLRALSEAEQSRRRREAEAALRERDERYALAAAGSSGGIWDWDLLAGRIYLAPRWNELLGSTGGATVATFDDWLALVHPDDRETFVRLVELHRRGDTPVLEVELRLRHRSGSFVWVLCRGLASRGANGEAKRMAGSITDVSDLRRALEQLLKNARTDSLTGLPNRQRFLDRVTHALDLTHRLPEFRAAVLLVDLDRFTLLNEALGLSAGDRVLATTAQRLAGAVSSHDLVARLGEDSFGVLLEQVNEPSEARARASGLLAALAEPFFVAARTVVAGASIGIVEDVRPYGEAEDVLRDAETAVARAKRLGRGRWSVFDPRVRGELSSRYVLRTDLKRAIERHELALEFQPIASLVDGTLVGCEALVRWQHPEQGPVSPAVFVPLAEEEGLVSRLGELVLEDACRIAHGWSGSGIGPITLSVNVSAVQFRSSDVARAVSAALEASGLRPDCLQIELTEGAVMEDPEAAARSLRALRDLGVGISLDDFGTGYSSLAQLKRFPITSLKIDRSFISDLPGNAESAAIARAVLSMAESLQLGVVAEGIESDEQRSALVGWGCRYGQGFLIGRPMPPEDFLARARRWA